MDPTDAKAPKDKRDYAEAQQGSNTEAILPWSRWETPLLLILCGLTMLLWILQNAGYQASWFTLIGPWVALGMTVLGLGLSIIFVIGMLSRKRQGRIVTTTPRVAQDDASAPPIEDKTFWQAMQELHARLTRALFAEMDTRLGKIMGQTIERLTIDIEDPEVRERTTEALRKVKLVYLLGLWRQKGRLGQAEYEELEQFLYRTMDSGQTAAPGAMNDG
jgi:hypothetical protein